MVKCPTPKQMETNKKRENVKNNVIWLVLAVIGLVVYGAGLTKAQETTDEPQTTQIKTLTLEDIPDVKIKEKTLAIMASSTLDLSEAQKTQFQREDNQKTQEILNKILYELRMIKIIMQKNEK